MELHVKQRCGTAKQYRRSRPSVRYRSTVPQYVRAALPNSRTRDVCVSLPRPYSIWGSPEFPVFHGKLS